MRNFFGLGNGHAATEEIEPAIRSLRRVNACAVPSPAQRFAGGGQTGATPVAPAENAIDPTQAPVVRAVALVGGVRFAQGEIEQITELARITFARIVNDEVRLGTHLYNKIAVAQLTENEKTFLLFADRAVATADEISAVVDHLRKAGWNLVNAGPQGYFTASALILALAQGHVDSDALKFERKLRADPALNALFNTFKGIVAWAYVNNADDIDFALDLHADKSQICFKIGGRYVRPRMHSMPTETMNSLLGTAFQKTGGAADAMFQTKIEQQAKLEIDLPPTQMTPKGARVRLRWSGMAIDRGTVVTMRVQRLGESANIRSLESAGYPRSHMEILRRVIHSEGGMVVFSGVVGSGKSTSLAQLLRELPHHIKMVSIEDPVELEIPHMYQKTVTRDLSTTGEDPAFKSAVAALYRSALDVLYLGEIRDTITGMIARQVAESGHSVYTTTHAKGALGIIDRFASPAIGMPREVLATPDILKVLVYQALLPVTCTHCGMAHDQYASEFNLNGDKLSEFHHYFERLERLYSIDGAKFRLRNPLGCDRCRKSDLPELNGFTGRTVVSEMVEPDEEMLRLILAGNNVELTRYWRSLAGSSFEDENLTGKTAMECSIFKASQGIIDPREIEPRFMSFETVEQKRQLAKRFGVTGPGVA